VGDLYDTPVLLDADDEPELKKLPPDDWLLLDDDCDDCDDDDCDDVWDDVAVDVFVVVVTI
jgi:hypothetical protein